MRRLLNLGCGQTFHEDWVNVDFRPQPPRVVGYDLSLGVPFPDDLFDVVYHSHIIEHFPRATAAAFLLECWRVLRPGGILRLAAPDLEGAARAYLQALEAARLGEPEADARHEWMTVELVDQLARHHSGGEMLEFWRRDPVPALDFVLERMGAQARESILALRQAPKPAPRQDADISPQEVGRFRLSGECHQWMYDSHSLGRLLVAAGFEAVRPVAASESDIPDFGRYHLDVEADGGVRKPDSFFLEARKPLADAQSDVPRVVSFCMQPTSGAGGSALRLHQGLREIGVADCLYVATKPAADMPGVTVIPAVAGSSVAREEKTGRFTNSQWPGFFKHMEKRLAAYPGRPANCEIFSDTQVTTRISDIPGTDAADILHLHWIAGTTDIVRDVEFLRGRPIVWTLHDMNPFTGGCHYAGDCQGFTRYCGACPQLGSSEDKDFSREIWLRKKAAYRELDITVVCPSRWLAGQAARSTLFQKKPISVIPYSLPTDVFRPLKAGAVRQGLGVDPDAFVLLFGADALDTARKGFAELLAALESLAASGHGGGITLMTFGDVSRLQRLTLPFPAVHLGRLESPNEVALAYNAANCLVIPSLEDNLPNVALEALSCGLPVAGFATGGIPDMVEDGVTGRLVPTGDCQALAQALIAMRDMPADARSRMRRACRQTALLRYSMPVQARAYLELYQRLLARPAGAAG